MQTNEKLYSIVCAQHFSEGSTNPDPNNSILKWPRFRADLFATDRRPWQLIFTIYTELKIEVGCYEAFTQRSPREVVEMRVVEPSDL